MGYLGYNPSGRYGESGRQPAGRQDRRPRRSRRSGIGDGYGAGIAVIAVLLIALSIGIYIYCTDNYTVAGGRIFDRDETAIDLHGAALDEPLQLLKFRQLESADLRGCGLSRDDYDMLAGKLPDCGITWTVPLSFGGFDSNIQSLDMGRAQAADFDMLGYFTQLSSVDASGCGEYALIKAYADSHEECSVSWTVGIAGHSYPSTATRIELGAADAESLELLEYLPELESIDCRGCTEYDRLFELWQTRGCEVLWTAPLLGKTYENTVEEIDISGTKVTDYDAFLAEVRNLIGLKKLIMFDCGLSNDQMGRLVEAYPSVKFVWRVYFGKWSLRTDATVFSTLNYDPPSYRLVDSEAEMLKYCTDLQILDLGHNSLTSAEPFAGLTELRVLILADNSISDISCLSGLTKLEYLEMFINRVSDISVIRNMPNLKDINFCWNRISDPSVIYDMPGIERVWMCGGQMSAETKTELKNKRPDIEYDLNSWYGSTNGTWRSHARFYKIQRAVKGGGGHKGYNGLPGYSWDDAP